MGELLGSLLVPGSIGGAIALIIITLVKQRGVDKVNVSATQQEHIKTLKAERDEADTRADRYLTLLDEERVKRQNAEAEAAAEKIINQRMVSQVEDLTNQVVLLRAEVEQLRVQLNGGIA